MKSNQLPKIKAKSARRVGRGIGSTKGKTSGRGTKGQKARGKVPMSLIGASVYKKLPLKRGKGNSPVADKPLGINLRELSVFKTGSVVDLESLVAQKVIKKIPSKGVKILGGGETGSKLTIKVPVSKSARFKIESSGGKVENA